MTFTRTTWPNKNLHVTLNNPATTVGTQRQIDNVMTTIWSTEDISFYQGSARQRRPSVFGIAHYNNVSQVSLLFHIS